LWRLWDLCVGLMCVGLMCVGLKGVGLKGVGLMLVSMCVGFHVPSNIQHSHYLRRSSLQWHLQSGVLLPGGQCERVSTSMPARCVKCIATCYCTIVPHVGLYWLYNFQYRSDDEQTCSDHVECGIDPRISENVECFSC
jgi:hypothetical protein